MSETPSSSNDRSRWQLRRAVLWSAATAATTAAVWGIVACVVLFATGFLITEPWTRMNSALLFAPIGAGAIAGFSGVVLIDLIYFHRLHFLWPVCGIIIGMIGSVGAPWIAEQWKEFLPPLLGYTLTMGIAGGCIGLMAYTIYRSRPTERAERELYTIRHGALVRLLPLVSLSFLLVMLSVSRDYKRLFNWEVLSAGMIGIAAAWAILGQEYRIRQLERKLSGK